MLTIGKGITFEKQTSVITVNSRKSSLIFLCVLVFNLHSMQKFSLLKQFIIDFKFTFSILLIFELFCTTLYITNIFLHALQKLKFNFGLKKGGGVKQFKSNFQALTSLGSHASNSLRDLHSISLVLYKHHSVY